MHRLLIAVLFGCAGWGQTHTVTVRGIVKDGSGGAVKNAAVSAINIDQQRHWDAQTSETGEYVLVQIPPGNYALSVQAAGFKKYERQGLVLQVAQTAELDVSLELGSLGETVQVTAETPLVEPGSSFLGEVVTGRSADAMPLQTRNATQLVALTPGINDTSSFRAPAFSSANGTRVAFSASGGPGVMNEVILDGSPQTMIRLNEPAYIPMPEAIQELNVQTNSLPAEYGRSGGAVINIVHRSGTKEFHGQLYEFLRNDKLNANGFFENRNGRDRAPFRENDFGLALGGPLTRSRNSTFFFVNVQRILVSVHAFQTLTVPTARMKKGDFTEVATVYDPRTIDSNGARSPFPGNQIPSSRWNPIGVNLLKYYPDPTSPGVGNNFFARAAEYPSETDFSGKVDRRVSDRQNVFGRFSWQGGTDKKPNWFDNPASPNLSRVDVISHSTTLDDSCARGSWILHGNYGYAYDALSVPPAVPGFDPTSLGFPSSFRSGLQTANIPSISLSGGVSGLGPNASSAVFDLKSENHSFSGDAIRVVGAHTVKFGGTFRINRGSLYRPNSPSGSFSFAEGLTRDSFNGNRGGNGVASLLLGLPASGTVGYEPALAIQMLYSGLFVQDDWRVNSRFTLNLGLRWDGDRPLTERFDRTSWFDFNAPLPVTAPGLGTLHGALVFAGRNGAPRANRDSDNNNFGPRIGMAYSLGPHLALRSGFGLMYAPATGFDPSATSIGALSFNASTDYIASIDGGRTPFTTLSNPFPNGFNAPRRRAHVHRSKHQRHRARRPHALRRAMALQCAVRIAKYHAHRHRLRRERRVKLRAQAQLNQLPDQYLSLGDGLNRVVANPFFGIVPATSSLGQPTITAGQLLRPYPQLNALTQTWGSFAHSSYHSLQAKFRRRYRGGLQMLAAYTWSKMLDDNSGAGNSGNQQPGFTDNNRRDLDKSYSSFDIPHRLVVSFDYELPFGAGRSLLNHKGVANAVVGGWSLSGIATIESGPPISVTATPNTTSSFGGGQRPNRTGISSVTPGSPQERLDNYIDSAAFTLAPRYAFGNTSRFLPENRDPGRHDWDVTLAKSFPIGERFHLDFRAAAFNLFNHPSFLGPCPPATGFGQPQFGTITQAENSRSIELALKLKF